MQCHGGCSPYEASFLNETGMCHHSAAGFQCFSATSSQKNTHCLHAFPLPFLRHIQTLPQDVVWAEGTDISVQWRRLARVASVDYFPSESCMSVLDTTNYGARYQNDRLLSRPSNSYPTTTSASTVSCLERRQSASEVLNKPKQRVHGSSAN